MSGRSVSPVEELIGRNVALYLMGRIVPLVVALISVPVIIRSLGAERFGLLSLAWTLVGAFNVFDLGLGRATTKFVSEERGRESLGATAHYIWTSAAMLAALGLGYSLLLGTATQFLVGRLLKISSLLVPEAIALFHVVAIAIPIVLLSLSFQGSLEARQRFDLTVAIQVPTGSLGFLIPMVGVWLGYDLPRIMLLMLGLRLVTLASYLAFCFMEFPDMRQGVSLSGIAARRLLRYGSWIALYTALLSALLYLDRFLIGALVSVKDLAYFVVPNEIVSRLQFLPGSLAAVLFPVFSSLAIGSPRSLERLYVRGTKFSVLATIPILLAGTVLGHDILRVWLGRDFSEVSAILLQIMVIGVAFNSLTDLSMNAFDAVGRPDLRVKIGLAYAVMTLPIISLLIIKAGLVGAAIGWVVRNMMGFLMALFVGRRLLVLDPEAFAEHGSLKAAMLWVSAAAFGIGLIAAFRDSRGDVPLGELLFPIVTSAFAAVAWYRVLDEVDRTVVRAAISRITLGIFKVD